MKLVAALTCLCLLSLFSELSQGSVLTLNHHEWLHEWMTLYSRKALVLHLPPAMKIHEVVKVKKMLDKDHDETPCVPITLGFQGQKNATHVLEKTTSEDLHLFLIDPKHMNQSIETLGNLYEERKRSNHEFWIIDVSAFESIEAATIGLQNMSLDIDDDVFFIMFEAKKAMIWEAYKINPTQSLIVQPIGHWNQDTGLNMSKVEKWHRRRSLQGYRFKCVTVPTGPYVTEMTPVGPGLWKMKGMFAEVFENLKEIMNFTYDLTKPPDGHYGAIQSDDTWSGMVGMLSRGEIDIAPTDFTVTAERSEVMTFAIPITEIYHSLFIKNPSESLHYKAYIDPFHWKLWVTILGLIMIGSPILFLTTRSGAKKQEFTFVKCLIFFFSALTMRSWSEVPSKPAPRTAFFGLLFFGIMIYYHWEAMLISYLSTRVTQLPFKSIPQLMTSSSYQIILVPGSSYMDAFKTSKDPTWKAAWEERIEPGLGELEGLFSQELVELLEHDSEAALYDNYFSITTYKQYIDCQIVAIPAKYDFKPYAFGFQKDSPFLDMFNFYLKEMKEKGSLDQIIKRYQSEPQVCPDYNGKALRFGHVFTAFGILCLGGGVALLLLGIEIIVTILGLDIPICYSYGTKDYF